MEEENRFGVQGLILHLDRVPSAGENRTSRTFMFSGFLEFDSDHSRENVSMFRKL